MAFKDLIKHQRSGGKSVGETLKTATLMTLKEKLDPRNMLFKKDSLMTALFPGLKGYKAEFKNDKLKKEETENISSKEISQKLDIIAKNTLVLPMMHRDINVMRQSLIKLVKLAGGTQRDKADKFFQTEAEREALYESKFGKKDVLAKEGKDGKDGEKKGFFGTLLAGLTSLFMGKFGLFNILKSFLGLFTGEWGLLKIFEKLVGFFVGEGGLIRLFGALVGVLSGPLGLVALFAAAAAALTSFIKSSRDESAAKGDIRGLDATANAGVRFEPGGEYGHGSTGGTVLEQLETEKSVLMKQNTPESKRALNIVDARIEKYKASVAKQELLSKRPWFGKKSKEEWDAKNKKKLDEYDEIIKKNDEIIKNKGEKPLAPQSSSKASASPTEPQKNDFQITKEIRLKDANENFKENVAAIQDRTAKTKGLYIGGEEYIPGKPLSENQMMEIEIAKANYNSKYPADVEAQYAKQSRSVSPINNVVASAPKVTPASAASSAASKEKSTIEKVITTAGDFVGSAAAGNYGVSKWGMDAVQPTRTQTVANAPSVPSPTKVESGSASGTGSAKEAMDFFLSKGWTKEQASGLVGNLIVESGNFAPDVVSGKRTGDNGAAVGIAQWHPDRQQKFQKLYGKPLKGSSFQEQLEFIQWELMNDEKNAGLALKSANTAEQAAFIVDKYYERSSGAHLQKRMGEAVALMGDNYKPSPISTPTNNTQYASSNGFGAAGFADGLLGGMENVDTASMLPQLLSAFTGQGMEGTQDERISKLAGVFGGPEKFQGIANAISAAVTGGGASSLVPITPDQKQTDELSNTLKNAVMPKDGVASGSMLNQVSTENAVAQATQQPIVIDNTQQNQGNQSIGQKQPAPAAHNQNSKGVSVAYDAELMNSMIMRTIAV